MAKVGLRDILSCDLAVVGVSVIKMGGVSGRWFFGQDDQLSGELVVLTV